MKYSRALRCVIHMCMMHMCMMHSVYVCVWVCAHVRDEMWWWMHGKRKLFPLKLPTYLRSTGMSENVYMQTCSYFTHDAPSVMLLINASRPRDTLGTYSRLWSLLRRLAAEAGCQLRSKTRGLPGVLSGLGRALGSEVVRAAASMKWQPNQCHCVSYLNPYNPPLNVRVLLWIGQSNNFWKVVRNHWLKGLINLFHVYFKPSS